MTALLVGGSEELSETISLMLKVRWRELVLLRAVETGEAEGLARREQPDIVILHLDSPGAGCFDLITQIRSFSRVPVIVLGQHGDVIDRVKALEMGADDWIPHDFMPMEFIARVNAILRRSNPHADNRLSCFFNGRLRINYAAREVCVLGKRVNLTPTEYKVLYQLVKNEGMVVSCTDLLQSVWGPGYETDPEFVKKYVYRLRCKLEQDPANPQLIVTQRGAGYCYSASQQQPD
jgi:two-component system KDP operon response regulator KdpE